MPIPEPATPAANQGATQGAPPAPPSARPSIVEQRAATRAAVLAGLPRQAPPQPSAPAPAPVAAPPPAAPAAADPAKISDTTPEVSENSEPPGMAAVRKAEVHLRRQLAEEQARARAELERERSTWMTKVQAAEERERALAAARQDPEAALRALGIGEDEYADWSRVLYALTPEGAKNPDAKRYVQERLQRGKERSEVDQLRDQVEQLRRDREQEQARAQSEQLTERYYSGFATAIEASAPIARARHAADPAGLRADLLATAERLYVESGPSNDLREVPSHAEVVKAYEADRRATLIQLKAEYEAIAGASATPPATPPPTPPPAPPGATPPHRKLSRAELIAAAQSMRQG
jgi:hypothetical protein